MEDYVIGIYDFTLSKLLSFNQNAIIGFVTFYRILFTLTTQKCIFAFLHFECDSLKAIHKSYDISYSYHGRIELMQYSKFSKNVKPRNQLLHFD